MSKTSVAFICHLLTFVVWLQDDRNRISVCGYAWTKMSGDVGVQGWNGEMVRWMVVKRFTGLLD